MAEEPIHKDNPRKHLATQRLEIKVGHDDDGLKNAVTAAELRSEVEARLQFEMLLSNISTRFLNLPPELVDREIEAAQQEVCKCLGFDRSVVWQIAGADGIKLNLTHVVQPRDGPPAPAQMDSRVYFPWLMQRVLFGETIPIARVDDLPAQATRDKESLRHYGTKSTLIVPLRAGEQVFAAVTFAVMREERDWPEPLVKRLQLVAQIFANAIARARGEAALRESEARFRSLADSVPVFIWMSGVDKLCTFVNKPWLDFTGRTAEQEMGNGWAEGIHPDDLPGCLKTYVESFDARKSFVLQYRLRRHDGEYRWISDSGTPMYEANGNFAGYIGSCLDITEQKLAEDSLKHALDEGKQLQKQILEENVYLHQEVKSLRRHHALSVKVRASVVFSQMQRRWRLPAPQFCFWVRPARGKN